MLEYQQSAYYNSHTLKFISLCFCVFSGPWSLILLLRIGEVVTLQDAFWESVPLEGRSSVILLGDHVVHTEGAQLLPVMSKLIKSLSYKR